MQLPENLAFDVSIQSRVPGGCSTGTSAAVSVALIGALDAATYGRMTPAEVAMKAQEIETVNLKQQCGIQDQLAAAYGGILYIKMFKYPPCLDLIPGDPQLLALGDRDAHLSHLSRTVRTKSSKVHEMVIRDLEDAGPEDSRLRKLRTFAPRAKNAIYESDLRELGRIMIANTEAQAELHQELISPMAQQTIEIAKRHGAIGWKVNGAGGRRRLAHNF